MKTLLLTFFVLSFSLPTLADEQVDQAVKKTQQDLRDREKRKQMIDTPQAKEADSAAASLAGDQQNLDAMYGISADLLGVINDQAKGDPMKMQEILLKAQKDPKAFFESLPEAQRNKIKSLSQSIEKRSPAAKKSSP